VNLRRRLKAVEQYRKQVSKKPFRLVILVICGPPNLANSICTGRVGADGQLTEIVQIDGGLDGWTDEEFEQWIASFPIYAPS
jgi:hypothetical protein